MQRTGKIMMGAVAWLLLGCAGNVSVDYDRAVRFRDFQTYALAATSAPSTGDVRLNSPLIHRRITAALRENMAAKGLREQPADPDFLVSYRIDLRQEIASRGSGLGLAFGTGLGRSGFGVGYDLPHAEVTTVEKCVLSVDILSVATEELLWRGTTSRTLATLDGPAAYDRFFAGLVREILATFPPQTP